MSVHASSTPSRPVSSVGVFGGAFDPPHVAHLAVIHAALKQLELDHLYVLPTADPWHRPGTVTPFAHRLQMARLAFAGIDGVSVDDLESRRDGPTYTIDTIQALRQSHADASIFLVLGEDQALSIRKWHRWPDLLALVTLCVVPRACADDGTVRQHDTVGDFEKQFDGPAPGGRRIEVQMPAMSTSASEVRRRVAAGEDWKSLVPLGVAGYIAKHQLYRSN